MDNSPLATLSTEIRCIIWGFVFEINGTKEDNIIQVHSGGQNWPPKPAITLLCKTIRDESLDTLFRGANIHFEVPTWGPQFNLGSSRPGVREAKFVGAINHIKSWLANTPHTEKVDQVKIVVADVDPFNPPNFALLNCLDRMLSTNEAARLFPRLSQPITMEFIIADNEDHEGKFIFPCKSHRHDPNLQGNILDESPTSSSRKSSFLFPLGDRNAAKLAVAAMVRQLNSRLVFEMIRRRPTCTPTVVRSMIIISTPCRNGFGWTETDRLIRALVSDDDGA